MHSYAFFWIYAVKIHPEKFTGKLFAIVALKTILYRRLIMEEAYVTHQRLQHHTFMYSWDQGKELTRHEQTQEKET